MYLVGLFGYLAKVAILSLLAISSGIGFSCGVFRGVVSRVLGVWVVFLCVLVCDAVWYAVGVLYLWYYTFGLYFMLVCVFL